MIKKPFNYSYDWLAAILFFLFLIANGCPSFDFLFIIRIGCGALLVVIEISDRDLRLRFETEIWDSDLRLRFERKYRKPGKSKNAIRQKCTNILWPWGHYILRLMMTLGVPQQQYGEKYPQYPFRGSHFWTCLILLYFRSFEVEICDWVWIRDWESRFEIWDWNLGW
jgi:hypothetical protein